MALITFQEALDHLRITLVTDEGSPEVITDDRYDDLVAKVAEADALVLDYIEMEEGDLVASGVSNNTPIVVKSAVKIILSALWEDREGTGIGDYFKEGGAVARLLRRTRVPTIA
jgi:hypothetical protein